MNTDAMVLRALLRLARRRLPADDEAIVVRVGAAPGAVRAAIRRLDAQGLVERRPTARLTMAGLAVAIAMLPGQGAAPARAAVRAPRAA
jgi:Mn-dependent DtxR family transcriptional regulator